MAIWLCVSVSVCLHSCVAVMYTYLVKELDSVAGELEHLHGAIKQDALADNLKSQIATQCSISNDAELLFQTFGSTLASRMH